MTTVIPETAKKPEDHLATTKERLDRQLEQDELLKGLPDVKPANRLRIRQTNATIALAIGLEELFTSLKDPDAPDYSELSKPELQQIAEGREGIEFTSKTTKDELVEMLEEDDKDLKFENPKEMLPFLNAAADIDDWAEANIAIDIQAYREWAEGQTHEVFFALLSRYSEALGK